MPTNYKLSTKLLCQNCNEEVQDIHAYNLHGQLCQECATIEWNQNYEIETQKLISKYD